MVKIKFLVAGEPQLMITSGTMSGMPPASVYGMPQQGMPQQGMPQQGMPQQGMPQQGVPQQGYGYQPGYAM